MTGQEISFTLAITSAAQQKLRAVNGELKKGFYETTRRRFDEFTKSEARFILRNPRKFRANLVARGNGQSNRTNAATFQSATYRQEFLAYAIEETKNRGVVIPPPL